MRDSTEVKNTILRAASIFRPGLQFTIFLGHQQVNSIQASLFICNMKYPHSVKLLKAQREVICVKFFSLRFREGGQDFFV